MSIEENKKIMKRIIEEVFNKGNLNVIPEIYAPDYTYHGPDGQTVSGMDGFKGMFEMYLSAFPDLHMQAHDIIIEEDKVACRVTITGTHTGDLMGIPPTSKSFKYESASILHFADGREIESWEYGDPNSIFMQLGIIPPSQ